MGVSGENVGHGREFVVDEATSPWHLQQQPQIAGTCDLVRNGNLNSVVDEATSPCVSGNCLGLGLMASSTTAFV